MDGIQRAGGGWGGGGGEEEEEEMGGGGKSLVVFLPLLLRHSDILTAPLPRGAALTMGLHRLSASPSFFFFSPPSRS